MKTLDKPVDETPEPIQRRRSTVVAFLVSLRPRQWTKNLLLFAGLLFTLDEGHNSAQVIKVVAAFGVFCLLSSCVYLINDVVDRDRDRVHPKKCRRPIASGELSVPTALVAAAILGVSSLTAAFFLGKLFGITALIYFGLTVCYSFYLKNVVILDVLVLASGFVLRAMAGAVVIGELISGWLILCTMMLALFLALSKRKAELLASLDSGGASSRRILAEYSGPMLDQMIVIVTSACLMSYALYTFDSPTGARHHHYLMLTIPFVLYGIFRYLYLAHRHDVGKSPDSVLIEDRPILINIVLFAATTAAIVSHLMEHWVSLVVH